MRAAFWFLVLFVLAAAVALLAGDNRGMVALFWAPWRWDFSLNLAVLLLLIVFVMVYALLRAFTGLAALPQQARQWRVRHKEHALYTALLDALAQLYAGRFTRARKAAQAALARERSLLGHGADLPQAQQQQLRTLAHLLAAESAHALQDRSARDAHLQQALAEGGMTGAMGETRQGAQLRAAVWALENNDPSGALERLDELPLGAQRRTLALRLHLKAARQAGQTLAALETARLLAKHRAFSEAAAQSIVRSLAAELIAGARDSGQLLRVWGQLDAAERDMPETGLHAAQRMIALHGDRGVARGWLLPVWERMDSLSDDMRVQLVRALEAALDPVDPQWLARIEKAQRAHARDAALQYLAGMVYLKVQLWGKAQQLLMQAAAGLHEPALLRRVWRSLAELAEQRGDMQAAAMAWKRAAQS
ncbi:MAG: heme biosynthesis protein HemY [Burkholderiaceae bacterium]|jgi:HemY protein|nr:heme biosynthesis protein HemY [Burkholderiaceae bacterium]